MDKPENILTRAYERILKDQKILDLMQYIEQQESALERLTDDLKYKISHNKSKTRRLEKSELERAAWEGKFHQVVRENNALRRKLHNAVMGGEENAYEKSIRRNDPTPVKMNGTGINEALVADKLIEAAVEKG